MTRSAVRSLAADLEQCSPLSLLAVGVPPSLILDLAGVEPLDSIAYLVDEGGDAGWLP